MAQVDGSGTLDVTAVTDTSSKSKKFGVLVAVIVNKLSVPVAVTVVW